MKKFIALLLSLMLVFSLVGCSTTPSEETTEEATTTETTEETTEEEMSGGEYMLGVAAIPMSYSKSAADGENAVAEMETSMMAVIFDMDGKVMDVSFDVTEQIVEFDSTGAVANEIETRTKVQRGDEYGMKDYSPIKKEAYEQFMALEEWMVGKTVEEISSMHSTDEDLKAGVTIAISDYIENLNKAYETAMPLSEMPADVALGVSVTVAPKEGDGTETGPMVEITSTFVGLATNSEGTIIDLKFDASQQYINFDVDGMLTGEIELRTKVERGADYNMIIASPIEKELDEQLAALEDYSVGKTIDEVLAMPTYEKSEDYPNIPDVEDLKTSVTIDITDYQKALMDAKTKLS